MRSTFAQGFRVQRRVVEALMTRDVVARFGRGNLGFLWLVIEPMLLCVGVMLLWSVMKSGTEHGVQVAALVFTGYMPLTLWRHVSNRGVNAFRTSVNLLYHRQLSIFDILFAKTVMEVGGTTLAAVVVYASLKAMGVTIAFQHTGYILLGWLGLASLAFGFMLILAGLIELFEPMEKFIQPIQYLTVPISGCFFMVEWISAAKRDVILLNPQVHCFEMIRQGMLSNVETHYSAAYLATCTVILNAIGFHLMSIARNRLHFN